MSIIACHLAPWHSSVHAQQRSFWPSGLLCQLPSFKLGAPAGSTSNAAGAIASSCASSVPGRGSKGRSGARGCLQRGARRAQHERSAGIGARLNSLGSPVGEETHIYDTSVPASASATRCSVLASTSGSSIPAGSLLCSVSGSLVRAKLKESEGSVRYRASGLQGCSSMAP